MSSQVDLLAKLPEVPRFQLAAMSLTGPGKAAMSVSMQRWGESAWCHIAAGRICAPWQLLHCSVQLRLDRRLDIHAGEA
jgi:hypothetical protein